MYTSPETHIARTSVLPINIDICDYVMVRAHTKPSQYLQAMWPGPTKEVDTKSDSLFTVEYISIHQHHVVHAQSMIVYAMTSFGRKASYELKQQAMHFDARYHLV